MRSKADLTPSEQRAGNDTSSEFAVGRIVAGRFRVDGVLGEGGHGVVCAATQLSVNRRVALKVLRPEFSANEEMVARFAREAESLSKMQHPNIVTLLEFGRSASGALFLVMEFVDGVLLRDQIAEKKLSPEGAVRIGAQILAALAHAHRQKIVHRDLKPSNVMLSSAGTETAFVKLLDFGLARLFDGWGARRNLTATGMVVGTPAYLAPEQALGRSIDGRTDIYSVGVMLYEMVTGAQPFSAELTREMILKQVNATPSALDSRVPPRIARAILKALAKEALDRFQTADEMREALVAEGDGANLVLGSETIGKDDENATHNYFFPRRRSAKRRWVWALGAVLGCGIAVLIATSGVLSGDEAPAPVLAPAPAPGRPEATGLSLEIRDKPVLPQASGLKPHVSSAPAPASVPRVDFRVRVRCEDVKQLCWASISLDGAEPKATSVASFSVRRGDHTVTVHKPGYRSERRSIVLNRAAQSVTISLTRFR